MTKQQSFQAARNVITSKRSDITRKGLQDRRQGVWDALVSRSTKAIHHAPRLLGKRWQIRHLMLGSGGGQRLPISVYFLHFPNVQLPRKNHRQREILCFTPK